MENKMFNFISKWFYLLYIVFTVNLLIISSGMYLTWSSPVIPKLTNASRLNENPLGRVITESEASWIGSLVNVGAMVIPPLSSYSMDKIGRKYTIILTGIPYLVSSLLLAFCNKIEWYYIARILGGFSLGSIFIVLPVYTAEIAEKHIRGFLGATLQVFLTFGMLLSFAIGPYLSAMWLGLAFASVPMVFLILSFRLPESPYYLVKKHKVQEAENVLKKISPHKSDDIVVKDLDEIKYYIKLGSDGNFLDLFKTRTGLIGLIGSCTLISFLQLSGINPILFYSESLFIESGTKIPPEICTIIYGSTQLAATLVTPFFIDSIGRKFWSILSSFIMLISQVPLGVYFYFKEKGDNVSEFNWASIVCLVGFVMGFNVGCASVPYIFMSEIFPESMKSTAVTIAGVLQWFISFLLTLLFMPMVNGMGTSGVFFFYGAWNFLAIVYVMLFIPETKGKSLQEIQDMLEKKKDRSRK